MLSRPQNIRKNKFEISQIIYKIGGKNSSISSTFAISSIEILLIYLKMNGLKSSKIRRIVINIV